MISQCPHCKTRFVVDEAKLNVANGSVRCGACMQVFSAIDHQMTHHRNTSDDTLKEKKPTAIGSKNTSDKRLKDSSDERLLDSLPEIDDSNLSSHKADNNLSIKTNQDIPQNDERQEPFIESMVHFETPPIIDAPPIEMDVHEKPPLKNRIFGIIGASVCLVLVFALSLHWLLAHPDQFKDHPRWRDTYQLACRLADPVISCGPSEHKNAYLAQSLRIISNTVTSHPEQENTLLLEAVILNMTKESLPFPTINVQFSNIKEQLLNDFYFTAADYLRGELEHAQHLPPATPVHIALSIIDPGPAAVNYNIELR